MKLFLASIVILLVVIVVWPVLTAPLIALANYGTGRG